MDLLATMLIHVLQKYFAKYAFRQKKLYRKLSCIVIDKKQSNIIINLNKKEFYILLYKTKPL